MALSVEKPNEHLQGWLQGARGTTFLWLFSYGAKEVGQHELHGPPGLLGLHAFFFSAPFCLLSFTSIALVKRRKPGSFQYSFVTAGSRVTLDFNAKVFLAR
jgi:hypothetical protein